MQKEKILLKHHKELKKKDIQKCYFFFLFGTALAVNIAPFEVQAGKSFWRIYQNESFVCHNFRSTVFSHACDQ